PSRPVRPLGAQQAFNRLLRLPLQPLQVCPPTIQGPAQPTASPLKRRRAGHPRSLQPVTRSATPSIQPPAGLHGAIRLPRRSPPPSPHLPPATAPCNRRPRTERREEEEGSNGILLLGETDPIRPPSVDPGLKGPIRTRQRFDKELLSPPHPFWSVTE